MAKYFIGVASYDHVRLGVEGGFCQLNHGKLHGLKKMVKGDYIIFYSPKMTLKGKEPCQKFTAIGKMKDDTIYTYEMAPGFIPYRRDVIYYKDITPTAIHPLIDDLTFIKDKTHYGYPFHLGHLEISKEDFILIAIHMGVPIKENQSEE